MSEELSPILLSQPNATPEDEAAVVHALRSGWLAPVGPALDGFEADMAGYLGVGCAVGLASGTAAIHLALKYLGVQPGDAVLVPTATFGATAFAVTYLGATPVFVDIDAESWGMDPGCAAEAIATLSAVGQRISAAIPVDLYGSPPQYSALEALFEEHGIPLLADAAEGLGGWFGDRRLGTIGVGGVLSFNGNKLITTSGGGMLVTNDVVMAKRIRKWATQSREPEPWYEHAEIGYNYRLSNLLAALGQSQLRRADQEVARRRAIRDLYREHLSSLDGVFIQGDPPWGKSNAWLSVARFDPDLYPDAPTRVREHLAELHIEARPIWKPLHQQPVFRENLRFLNGQADALFREGLCLPSGTTLSDADIERVSIAVIKSLKRD